MDKTPNEHSEPIEQQDDAPLPEFDDERAKELLREDFRSLIRSMSCITCTLALATSFFAPFIGYLAFGSPGFFDDLELLARDILLIVVLFWPISVPCIAAALAAGGFLTARLFNSNARRYVPLICVALPTLAYRVGYMYAAGTGAPNGY